MSWREQFLTIQLMKWNWILICFVLAWYWWSLASAMVSGDTHFLLSLCYLPSHLPMLFFKDVHSHLRAIPNISEHYGEFPFTFCYSFYSLPLLSGISVRQTQSLNGLHQWLLFLFLSSFSHVAVFHFCFWGLISLSHIVIDRPLAGPYPFLPGSPASFCKSDHSCPYIRKRSSSRTTPTQLSSP